MTSSTEIEVLKPPRSFDTHHDDVIHDAKVDFYGRRLATASSDRTIRIFQINENETETLLTILSGHEGPVWQVAWAHPKFGSILASCSYDGSVIIWQEDQQQKSSQNPMGTHATWTRSKIHRVHESSVNSICFAPHIYGLHLACASSDGKVSILSKSQAGEEWEWKVISAHSSGCNSVSWRPSSVPKSLLELDFNALEREPVPLGPKMIATGGCDNTVKLWKVVLEGGDDGNVCEKWELEATLSDHTDWVRDVCWRPNLGQVSHMLVSCSQDNTVLIWKLGCESKRWESIKLKPTPFADTLWRVSFSDYGHLLAVSCGDNSVTLWKENFEDGTWELVGNVDETVTETLKIEEPLAVAPPASVPIPEINFKTANVPKFGSDAGYMKPMSPMMLAPSISHNQISPGYNQIDQAYDDFQNAKAPTIHSMDQPIFQTNILAEPVISDNTTGYAYDSVGYFNDNTGYSSDNHGYANDSDAVGVPVNAQYSSYAQNDDEFNKDIGFVGSNANDYQTQEQEGYKNQEHLPQYDQSEYDASQYTYQYEQPGNYISYEQHQQAPDLSYEQQSQNQESTYDQSQNQESTYKQPLHHETAYDQSKYQEASHYDQAQYHQQPQYDAYQQDGYAPYYPTETENSVEGDPSVQPAIDYTLQYEGYQSTRNDTVNF